MCLVGAASGDGWALVAGDTSAPGPDGARRIPIARPLVEHRSGWSVMGCDELSGALLPAHSAASLLGLGDAQRTAEHWRSLADGLARARWGRTAARPGRPHGWAHFATLEDGRPAVWELSTEGTAARAPAGKAGICPIDTGRDLQRAIDRRVQRIEGQAGLLEAVREFAAAAVELAELTPLVGPFVVLGSVELGPEGLCRRSWAGRASELAALECSELQEAAAWWLPPEEPVVGSFSRP